VPNVIKQTCQAWIVLTGKNCLRGKYSLEVCQPYAPLVGTCCVSVDYQQMVFSKIECPHHVCIACVQDFEPLRIFYVKFVRINPYNRSCDIACELALSLFLFLPTASPLRYADATCRPHAPYCSCIFSISKEYVPPWPLRLS